MEDYQTGGETSGSRVETEKMNSDMNQNQGEAGLFRKLAEAGLGEPEQLAKRFRTILFCADEVEKPGSVYALLEDLGEVKGIRLHVLHVLPSLHRYMPTETILDQSSGQVTQASSEFMEKTLSKLRRCYPHPEGQPGKYRYKVCVGTAYVEILRYIRENPVDLIVLGAMGPSKYGRTHYGSTVEKVCAKARCPVVIVDEQQKMEVVECKYAKA
ncbi:universal stress protein [Dethiosulfatarculus sandiegensis]|uniref:Universal stress protein n=1 Tax=Dethiosulfatarculus sandiegensis TaxID=1429043 RepID=A0A0D2GK78_9BACT|nr:universal stress protein [Dethiosulfatarculus sandiegensis]KIX15172.1 universal stress protein [Dethiosulfatarculus sandiegensis]